MGTFTAPPPAAAPTTDVAAEGTPTFPAEGTVESGDKEADKSMHKLDKEVEDAKDKIEELNDENALDPDDTAEVEAHIRQAIPGAIGLPDRAGVIRNAEGKVAYAPAGTLNAAQAGVQEDASGHVSSVGTDNSEKSGTRI